MENKKIALLTINDVNFGNRLQNFALTNILEKKDYLVCTLVLNKILFKKRLRTFYYQFIFSLKNIFKKNMYEKQRKNKFARFNLGLSFYTKILLGNKMKKEIGEKFDCFVIGSDQIWNPNFYGDTILFNFLPFISENKKIAIAPSISCDSLTPAQTYFFQQGLSNFKYLSCREEQGSRLIEKVSGKHCETIIDPTLMLSQDEWNKVIKKPSFHKENERYLLLYFLGNLTNEYCNIIDEISKKYNLNVINILDKTSVYYSCGPSEFIYMIKNASLVITDSFHGSIFSYIYDKPFKIFKRVDNIKSMNSRLENLIDKLHLPSDIFISSKDNLDIDNILNVEYDKSYLKNEQTKFNEYVDSCLEQVMKVE